MEYCIAKPSGQLSEIVKHYWAIENSIPNGEEHIQRIVPSGLTELIFYFDNWPNSSHKLLTVSDNSMITGQINQYYDLRITGKLSLFSILFHPYGLSQILNIPVNELHNKNIPLRFILKGVNELETKLYESSTFRKRIDAAEQFLINLQKRTQTKYQFTRIENSIRTINKTLGIITTEQLASEACLSRKQFERNFSAFVGTSPKQFIKTVRFQHAIYEKNKNMEVSLTAISQDCGYFDQSHMIHDFITLSGMTPGKYFSECEPFSDYFQ